MSEIGLRLYQTKVGDYATDVKPVSDGHLRILSLDGGGLRAIIQVC